VNPNSHHTTLDVETSNDPGWAAAGLFLEAFTRRDFAAAASCFAPDVCFRALVPPGPFSTVGAAAAAGHLQRWFGGEDSFEVIDASIGQLGSRIYLRWRVRMVSADHPNAARIVEQHAFATVTERIQSLDLLCSGFHTEDVAPITALDRSPAQQLADPGTEHCGRAADITDRAGAKR
jgi:hypothetical protein